MDNPVKTIPLTITEEHGLPALMANPYRGDAGTQWDTGTPTLEFTRDKQYEGLPLLLLFSDALGNAYEVNIGTDNTYTFTNALTQTGRIDMRIAFIDGEAYRNGSDSVAFHFRSAPQGGAIPEDAPNRVAELESHALASFTQTGDTVEFFTFQGQSAGTINAGGGGGGTSTTAWLPSVSEDGNLSWSQSSATAPPETRNIKGPQGLTGEKGERGEQGLTGVAGAAGAQGVQGEVGPRGEQGENGSAGPQGVQGESGPQGLKGDQGETGPTGSQGMQGERGEQGPKGDTGPAGADGNDGATGPVGADGYTPVRGVDFWTAADVAAMEAGTRDYIDTQLGVIVNGSY